MLDIEKFEQRAAELGRRRWRNLHTILPMACAEGTQGRDEVYHAMRQEIADGVLHRDDLFPGLDRYLWARAQVTLPPAREGCQVVGLFDFGRTAEGAIEGFESLLYLDGHPYQAVDQNHPEVVLDDFAGQTVTLTFLLWTGLGGKQPGTRQWHRIRQADVGYLDCAADELYYLIRTAAQTLRLLNDTQPARTDLLRAVNGALQRIDWDQDSFYDSLPGARDFLRQALADAKTSTGITVHTIGHTHIDVAWLWRLKHTREKAQRSFSTALRLMEEFPEYVFLQTQPQLYDYLRQDCPELYERIRKRVADGHWEPEGGMWLEADCNLTSGESLVRQLLYGIRFFQREFGVTCRYLWLPDVFGYSWALPQILRQCGIDTFMTTKISWNQFNTMPNDLFRWRGIDGSEVLTYFMECPPENKPMGDRFSTYNGVMSPRATLGSWTKFKNKDLTRHTLIPYGFGDGGGGTTRDMLKTQRAMQCMPGLPDIRPGKAGDFFRQLHADAEKAGAALPVWDGELYLEYHRGTYTTQAANKKANRQMENLLAETEWIASLRWLALGAYPAESLQECWQTVLRNQFHDIIPGSSIREVYEDSRAEYAAVEKTLHTLRSKLLGELTHPDRNGLVVRNPAGVSRGDCVLLPVTGEDVVCTADGQPLETQRVSGGVLARMEMPALSMRTIRLNHGSAPVVPPAFAWEEHTTTLQTPHYTLHWKDGVLESLFDRDNSREVLDGPGNLLRLYEDKPLNYDAWDIDIFYTEKSRVMPCLEPPRLVENGPLRAVVYTVYGTGASRVEQRVVVWRHSRRIDFETVVDWHEEHRLLKAEFPVAVRSTRATYDIQFGYVERPTHANTSWDMARFEVVGHKWADLSDAGYGVSLLNNCKYGYSVQGRKMTLSLLRSPTNPDETADRGEHRFTYALLPHAGTVVQADTIEEAERLNRPLQVTAGRVYQGSDIFWTDSNGILVDAIKKAEDDDCLIVRVHECRGATRRFVISSEKEVRRWAVCNLLEQEIGERQEKEQICGTLHPFELRTFKVWLNAQIK